MHYDASILIVDNCHFFLKHSKKELSKTGFNNIALLADPSALESSLNQATAYDLLVIEIQLGICNGLEIITKIRASGYEGLIASVSSDFSLDLINQAVLCGADDYFIKNKNFSISVEIDRLLEFYRFGRNRFPSVARLEDSSFLRGIGLTPFERQLVNAFFLHYPSQKELASILCKSEGYVRKTFSNIYRKFHVLNHAQLASMLTVCSRFSSLAVSHDLCQSTAHRNQQFYV